MRFSKFLCSLIFVLLVVSCSKIDTSNSLSRSLDNDCSNASTSNDVASSSFDHGYHPERGEDFSLEIDYTGSLTSLVNKMALNYTYECQFEILFSGGSIFNISPRETNIIGFSYQNYDIIATSAGTPPIIDQYVVREKNYLTFSKAQELGFFGEKKYEHMPMFYDTPWKEKCFSTETFWESNFSRGIFLYRNMLSFADHLDLVNTFGMWDSLICFLDKMGCIDVNQYVFLRNNVGCVLWPAFTVYSDDLSEVIGVSTFMDNGRMRTYMKEDGYENKINPELYAEGVKRAKETGDYFGRAAFYFTPEEFYPVGKQAFYDVMGGYVDL